uniref:Uncharacterized protein n=1 Tax=Sus scrofa TaxID=9823 RepID=A0A8D1M5C7_PIG
RGAEIRGGGRRQQHGGRARAAQLSSSRLSPPPPPESLELFSPRVLVVSPLPTHQSSGPPALLPFTATASPRVGRPVTPTPTPPTHKPAGLGHGGREAGVPLAPAVQRRRRGMDLSYETRDAGNFAWIVFRPIFFCYEKQERRFCINPNAGFVHQLQEYEAIYLAKLTIQMMSPLQIERSLSVHSGTTGSSKRTHEEEDDFGNMQVATAQNG